MLLVILTTALTAGLLVAFIATLATARPRGIDRRIDEVKQLTQNAFDPIARKQRQARLAQIEDVLESIGQTISAKSGNADEVRRILMHAGYRTARASSMFWGIRVTAMLGMGFVAFLTAPVFGAKTPVAVIIAVYCAAVGYLLPLFHIRSRAKKRQKEITLALPDALDLLVVCVEAGLGLNQGIVRVAGEIHHVSIVLAEELHLLNLEIRAGRPRNEALRNLAERTGVEDVRGLVSTLVQAERFGTPIGGALRVHAETLRDKRKQRAREAAAKTTIKLVFPLVFCIFPAMFVVLVGPGAIMIIEALAGL